MEAISNAGAAMGVLAKDGVVLVAEKKITSKLLDTKAVGVRREKMYKLDDHIACAVAGITADANILINICRLAAQQYHLAYQDPIPVEQLVQSVCDTKQGYTQFGGQRPFGVSLLYAGWDEHYGFQLYQSDPSGNYGGWKAAAIGAGHAAANNVLKTEYKEDITLAEAIPLLVKVLSKAMDTSLSADKMEIATMTKDASGKVVHRIFDSAEMQPFIDAANAEKAAKAQPHPECAAGGGAAWSVFEVCAWDARVDMLTVHPCSGLKTVGWADDVSMRLCMMVLAQVDGGTCMAQVDDGTREAPLTVLLLNDTCLVRYVW
eukprot:CAMPEP_0119105956 /NCGR_PEP_ID=MMETSP1180-20130426/3778_1 /TAXON_ID=3052 ORGANISM="Chlamydomonas cf sp, Strain CCMP681" /NCGR_SAMPLE_ID=MMETSP1180 /ASSEMBLY_ACC=CAM_ASM_000741 /LENGTH=317 /DNA_ID=CAMNT_0007091149 /DNA_START=94 /DNA_END=1045 /DNA_ORIENTATION=+